MLLGNSAASPVSRARPGGSDAATGLAGSASEPEATGTAAVRAAEVVAAAAAAGAGRTRFASFLPLGLVSIWQSAQASWYESNTTRVVGVRGDTPRGALRWPGRCPRCAPWPVGLSFYHPLGEESKDQGCSKASVRRYSLCCDAPGTEPPCPHARESGRSTSESNGRTRPRPQPS